MTTPNTVVIENNLTDYFSYGSKVRVERVLDAKWLTGCTFVISGFWEERDPLPGDMVLELYVSDPMDFYYDESMGILLGEGVYNELTGAPERIEWFTEKELKMLIDGEMEEACTKFANDFLPAALKIALRAQEKAKKLIKEELAKREAKKKKTKTLKKITRKKKARNKGKITGIE
jgi:hypothetical protein